MSLTQRKVLSFQYDLQVPSSGWGEDWEVSWILYCSGIADVVLHFRLLLSSAVSPSFNDCQERDWLRIGISLQSRSPVARSWNYRNSLHPDGSVWIGCLDQAASSTESEARVIWTEEVLSVLETGKQCTCSNRCLHWYLLHSNSKWLQKSIRK